MGVQAVESIIDGSAVSFRQWQRIQPLLLLHEHFDPKIAEKSRDVIQIPSGLIEKCGKLLQAGLQRLRSGFKSFRQSDADDREVKGRLGFVHPDKCELVAKRLDDTAQYGHIDGLGRRQWVRQVIAEFASPLGQLIDGVGKGCRGEVIPAGPIERLGLGLGKKMKFIAGHADRKLRCQWIEYVVSNKRQFSVEIIFKVLIRHLKFSEEARCTVNGYLFLSKNWDNVYELE